MLSVLLFLLAVSQPDEAAPAPTGDVVRMTDPPGMPEPERLTKEGAAKLIRSGIQPRGRPAPTHTERKKIFKDLVNPGLPDPPSPAPNDPPPLPGAVPAMRGDPRETARLAGEDEAASETGVATEEEEAPAQAPDPELHMSEDEGEANSATKEESEKGEESESEKEEESEETEVSGGSSDAGSAPPEGDAEATSTAAQKRDATAASTNETATAESNAASTNATGTEPSGTSNTTALEEIAALAKATNATTNADSDKTETSNAEAPAASEAEASDAEKAEGSEAGSERKNATASTGVYTAGAAGTASAAETGEGANGAEAAAEGGGAEEAGQPQPEGAEAAADAKAEETPKSEAETDGFEDVEAELEDAELDPFAEDDEPIDDEELASSEKEESDLKVEEPVKDEASSSTSLYQAIPFTLDFSTEDSSTATEIFRETSFELAVGSVPQVPGAAFWKVTLRPTGWEAPEYFTDKEKQGMTFVANADGFWKAPPTSEGDVRRMTKMKISVFPNLQYKVFLQPLGNDEKPVGEESSDSIYAMDNQKTQSGLRDTLGFTIAHRWEHDEVKAFFGKMANVESLHIEITPARDGGHEVLVYTDGNTPSEDALELEKLRINLVQHEAVALDVANYEGFWRSVSDVHVFQYKPSEIDAVEAYGKQMEDAKSFTENPIHGVRDFGTGETSEVKVQGVVGAPPKPVPAESSSWEREPGAPPVMGSVWWIFPIFALWIGLCGFLVFRARQAGVELSRPGQFFDWLDSSIRNMSGYVPPGVAVPSFADDRAGGQDEGAMFLSNVMTDMKIPAFAHKQYLQMLGEAHITTVSQMRKLDPRDWQRIGIPDTIVVEVMKRVKPPTPAASKFTHSTLRISNPGSSGKKAQKKPKTSKPAKETTRLRSPSDDDISSIDFSASS